MRAFSRVIQVIGGVLLSALSLSPQNGWGANTLSFSPSAAGVTKSVPEWGVDTALYHFDHMRQSVAHMGASNVDVVRLTFNPVEPLIDNGNGTFSLNQANKDAINFQLGLAGLAGNKPLALFPGGFGSTFNYTHWVRTIKATEEYIHTRPGWTTAPINSVEVFNEPDFWVGMGNGNDWNNAIIQLKSYPVFANTHFPAASTLNSNNAQFWYQGIPQATAGSSHLLGGSLTSYVNFMEYVKTQGEPFHNPELHSLGEAIVGAEHGMTSGVWWADVLRARGLFVQASDGKRLAYFEDLPRQSAAAVYRGPDGKIRAFAGGLERFGTATSYRFVSTDQDVYFNGIPVREFMLQTKFDEIASDTDNDFQNYGSWSNQGAYADVELDAASAQPALDGYRWKIVNAATGQVMEVAGSGTGDGALIRSASDTGGLNQLWNIHRTRNGYYHLYNANSGRTAEVAGGSLGNGAGVRQWGTADSSIQQWYLDDAGGGFFYLRNGNSFKYLTSSNSNSFQTDLATSNSNLQKWRFVMANPTTGPRSRYLLQGNVTDSAGANSGSAFGSPAYAAGPAGVPTTALQFDGANDYVQLPAGVANSADLTVSAWVYWNGTGGAWQRIFDFGNNTSQYMFLTPNSGDNTMRFAITKSGNNAEQALDTSPLPANQWVHLAVTLGGNTGILYINGKPQVAGQILLNPGDFNPTLNYIGKSQWPDPLFQGRIADFQLFNYALSSTQIDHLINRGAFNGDGLVDAADYTVWRDQLGATGLTPYAPGDANGDRSVTTADYDIWRRQFGQTIGVGSAAVGVAVPEPVAVGLVIGLLAIAFRRSVRQ